MKPLNNNETYVKVHWRSRKFPHDVSACMETVNALAAADVALQMVKASDVTVHLIRYKKNEYDDVLESMRVVKSTLYCHVYDWIVAGIEEYKEDSTLCSEILIENFRHSCPSLGWVH